MTSTHLRPHSEVGFGPIELFYVSGLLISMGAFVLQLGGTDLAVAPEAGAGSLLSQSVLAAFYSIGLMVLFRTQIAIKIFARTWPIFLLPFLAALSAVWAPDPMLTLRRSFALVGTICFGLSLAARFDFRSCLRLLIVALTLAMMLSIVWVFAFPQYGVHQSTDAIQMVHAGKWRGIFAHKNFLGGYVGGLTFALLAVYGRFAFKTILVRSIAMGVTLACLIGAGSATGYAIAFIITLLGFSLSVVAEQPPAQRFTLLVLCFGIVGLLLAFSNDLANVALTALGKDPDLTGRTEYWDILWQMMAGHWTLGYGYVSGFLSLESVIAEATNENFGSTHNGYLDILVSLGTVGLACGLGYLLWMFIKGIDFILRGPELLGRLRVFPICIVVYALQHNLVESSILAGNTLVPLVLAIAAGSLARANIAMNSERISDRAESGLTATSIGSSRVRRDQARDFEGVMGKQHSHRAPANAKRRRRPHNNTLGAN